MSAFFKTLSRPAICGAVGGGNLAFALVNVTEGRFILAAFSGLIGAWGVRAAMRREWW